MNPVSSHQHVGRGRQQTDHEAGEPGDVPQLGEVHESHRPDLGRHQRGDTQGQTNTPASDEIAAQILDVAPHPYACGDGADKVDNDDRPIDPGEVHGSNTCRQNWPYWFHFMKLMPQCGLAPVVQHVTRPAPKVRVASSGWRSLAIVNLDEAFSSPRAAGIG